jgi:hypothetical protein
MDCIYVFRVRGVKITAYPIRETIATEERAGGTMLTSFFLFVFHVMSVSVSGS